VTGVASGERSVRSVLLITASVVGVLLVAGVVLTGVVDRPALAALRADPVADLQIPQMRLVGTKADGGSDSFGIESQATLKRTFRPRPGGSVEEARRFAVRAARRTGWEFADLGGRSYGDYALKSVDGHSAHLSIGVYDGPAGPELSLLMSASQQGG
jgi:hypothetical protein